jgi:hypothetical protein
VWERSRWLQLIEPGVAHAIHLWWLAPDWRFAGSYVNLQEPMRRAPLGFDYMDHMLDIVIDPDLRWRWKDEDELAEAVSVGLVTQAWADEVRREGERVIERLERHQAPFCDGWEEWQPDPAWPVPTLPDGWDRLGRISGHAFPRSSCVLTGSCCDRIGARTPRRWPMRAATTSSSAGCRCRTRTPKPTR